MKLFPLLIFAICGGAYTAFYFSGRSEAVPFEGQTSIGSRLLSAADIDPTHAIVDGDEMPGIGALENNPDTALVYFNEADRRIHIKYLSPSK